MDHGTGGAVSLEQLNAEKTRLFRVARSGVSLPAAGAIYWLGLGVVGLYLPPRAWCLAAFGGIALFFPQEMVSVAGLGVGAELPVQLLAGGFLALASLNWMGRGAVYGGIYGRPIVLANFGFGMVTGGTVVSALLDERLGPWGWVLASVLLIHALAFWRVMRAPPWLGDSSDDTR